METRFPGSLTTLAEVLQAVFVFAIVVLAVWRVIRPSSGNWRAWLRACATIGICGGLLGTVVITGSMIDQFVSSSGDDSERYMRSSKGGADLTVGLSGVGRCR